MRNRYKQALPLIIGTLTAVMVVTGCASETKTDAKSDKQMREALHRPLKMNELPTEVQKMINSGKQAPVKQ